MKSIAAKLLSLLTITFFMFQVAEAKEMSLVKTSQAAFKTFEREGFGSSAISLDYLFLKVEKKQNFQSLTATDLEQFKFDNLTQKTTQFLNRLNTSYNLPINYKLRKQMQFDFYGLSQAIKKANQLSITVQTDYFDKLHDMLMGQGTSLFYASAKDKKKTDLFFTAYYLRELEFPTDMTARHLQALKKISKWNGVKNYSSKLAREAFRSGIQLNKLTSQQVDTLYEAAFLISLSDQETQLMQKMYLKQLQMIGDQEKVKEVKRQLASNILWQEARNLFSHPLDIFKFIQFCVGYVFIAWPLEVILIIVSIVIFGFQASTVLTAEERKKNSFWKKLWLMFTKSYLGANVPFFSKLAASLILFGVGLYFNSAKNFVETMMANM